MSRYSTLSVLANGSTSLSGNQASFEGAAITTCGHLSHCPARGQGDKQKDLAVVFVFSYPLVCPVELEI